MRTIRTRPSSLRAIAIAIAIAFSFFVCVSPPVLAQWSTDALSQPRYGLAATATGSELLFGGGAPDGPGYSDVVDIYDASTCSWSAAHLSLARFNLAATGAGTFALFGGGETGVEQRRVDLYDSATGTWTTADLSRARSHLAATSVTGRALFAGGTRNYEPQTRVDVFDATTGVWSTDELSVGRSSLAATTVGGLAIFAGGWITAVTSAVDVYDSSTGAWTTADLSQPRTQLAATSAGGKALFAGGSTPTQPSSRVDIYDAQTGVWSTAELSLARYDLAATAVGDLALFAGGRVAGGFSPVDVVDIYDAVSGTWSVTTLSNGRTQLAAAAVGNTAMFAGGRSLNASYDGTIDVFRAPLGEIYCTGFPNSTGVRARIAAGGSVFAGCGDVTLFAEDLPAGEFGYFLASRTQGMFYPPASSGLLCLSGDIGRFDRASEIVQGPSGSLALDLGAVPVNPPQAVQPGETWNFQCWYRDQSPVQTSNFSDGLSLVFD